MKAKVSPSRSFVVATMTRIANERGVCAKSVIGGSRYREHFEARRDALIEVWMGGRDRYSLIGIGRAFGLNHATVIHHIRKAQRHDDA